MDNTKKTLAQRFEILREKIQQSSFLKCEGLGNEVSIWIFCYDPSEEMQMQAFLKHLMSSKSLNCKPAEFNLYQVFLSICEDKHILKVLAPTEKQKGAKFILSQLRHLASNVAFADKIKSRMPEDANVILLTGIGDAYPFIRMHELLNALQDKISNIPIVAFYPGTYNGNDVKMFNLLDANSYYRAFNII